jgi:hypothetical protein
MGRLRPRHCSVALAALGLVIAWLGFATPGVAAPPSVPPGQKPTEVDVTNDLTYRWGEPQIAVNQKNPNNLIYYVLRDRFSFECVNSGATDCNDLFGVPGKIVNTLYVSFDRGKTWQERDVPSQVPGKDPLEWQGDPMAAATADGTFYIAWDAIHLDATPPLGSHIYGCIAASKSTDGGLTWSTPVCTGTPVDRPWLDTDLSTGRIYEVSSGFQGPLSGGVQGAAQGTINDRWIVASQDGVSWGPLHRLGGNQFSGATASRISAANGVLSATFRSTSSSACTFFVGGSAPCTVFQTSTDDGATWARHRIPVPDDSTGQVMLAADPTTSGHFSIAVLNSTASVFLAYQTTDSGATWTGPTSVTDSGPAFVKQRPWMAYSPDGVLGMMWRANQAAGQNTPYLVWAAISDDGGATFYPPLQISTVTSPGPDAGYTAEDDFSFTALSHQDAFVGWADWRGSPDSGDRAGFFSAVKLQAFENLTR